MRHAPLRSRIAGALAPLVAAAIVLGAIAGGGLFLSRTSAERPHQRDAGGRGRLLLFELRNRDRALLLVVGTSARGTPVALGVPGATRLTIPGQGDGSVNDVAELEGPQALVAVSNLIGLWIPHYAVTDPAHLSAVVDRAGGIQLLGQESSGADVAAALSTPGPAQMLTWREALIGLLAARAGWAKADLASSDDPAAAARILTAAGGASLATLPTESVAPGYSRPDYERIAALIGREFGLSYPARVRVIVLNGTGAPGIGESVARRLVPAGYRVVLSENASSFGHRQTLLVATSPDFMAAAERASRLLGVGAVSLSAVPSGLGDLTILVGEDYTNG